MSRLVAALVLVWGCGGPQREPQTPQPRPEPDAPLLAAEEPSAEPAAAPLLAAWPCPGCGTLPAGCNEPQLPENPGGAPLRSYSEMRGKQEHACTLPRTELGTLKGWEAFEGDCADGKRFLSLYETFEGETVARFYEGEQLVGVIKRSYMGFGDCDGWWSYGTPGSIQCKVARIDHLCPDGDG